MNTSMTLIQNGFAALTLVSWFIFIYILQKGILGSPLPDEQKKKLSRRIVIGFVLWVLFVSVWSLSGIMADFRTFPSNVAPVLIVPLVTSILITFSKTFTTVLRYIPVERLLYLQSFRIVVELLLWGLFATEILPVQMTFEGKNVDILVGLTGPVVGYLAVRQKIGRMALVLWNIAGLALLANIVIIAIFSMPTPLRVFTNEPSNTVVTYFPVSWLPGLLVPLAYTLHFLVLRKVMAHGYPENRN